MARKRMSPAELEAQKVQRLAEAISADWLNWGDGVGTLLPLIRKLWPKELPTQKLLAAIDYAATQPTLAPFPTREWLTSRLDREQAGVSADESMKTADRCAEMFGATVMFVLAATLVVVAARVIWVLVFRH